MVQYSLKFILFRSKFSSETPSSEASQIVLPIGTPYVGVNKITTLLLSN